MRWLPHIDVCLMLETNLNSVCNESEVSSILYVYIISGCYRMLVYACYSSMLSTHLPLVPHTVYPKKYAHGFCFVVLCCGYTLTDFPTSIRLTLLALWQSNDCPSASKATLMNMDKYFMWIHYEQLHNHNKAKHNKTVCIFIGIDCICVGELGQHCVRYLLEYC